MSYPDQTIMAGGDVPGNCFQAALAGVLGVSITAVPHFPLLGIHHWMRACVAWLEAEHDLIINTRPDEALGKVRLLHIINGQSPRGYSHAVIGDTTTGDMAHDPHPSRAGLTFINSRFYFHQKPRARGPLDEKEIDFGVEGNLEDANDEEARVFTLGVRFAEWKHGIAGSAEVMCPGCKGGGEGPTVMVGEHDEPTQCAKCGGRGTEIDHNGERYVEVGACPACNGSSGNAGVIETVDGAQQARNEGEQR